MRGRKYSYSRAASPPRGYSRRGRSRSPRNRNGYRSGDSPISLLVRNLHRDCRPEDLRGPFGQFGPLKDIYLPRDFYAGKPRGFGFVQYAYPEDVADAKHYLDGELVLGQEIKVRFAEENRKKPSEMRARERSRGHSYDYSRSGSRYSPSPRRRHYSRSVSPRDRRYRGRSYSRSPYRSVSRSRSRSRSP